MFRNREEAGEQLARQLQKYSGVNGVVLAIPRGGVPIGYVIATKLHLPLEIVLTRKIGHPANKEYAIGAAGPDEVFIVPHAGVSEEYIESELAAVRERLKDMQRRFMGNHRPADIRDRIVIVADDGIATGNTLIATVKVLRKREPAKIVVAAPVASGEAVRKLQKVADEVVVSLVPIEFHGVGSFYEDFSQVSDEEAKELLEKAWLENNAVTS